MVLAVEVFGYTLPSPGIGLVAVLFIVAVFLFNRSSGGLTGDTKEVGIEHECPRCGRHYKPEKVQVMDSGDTYHSYDDHCPGCGWDYKLGDPDKDRHIF